MTRIRVIGPGRAGTSLMAALRSTGRYRVLEPYDRHRDPADAARGVDVLVIATPDAAVAGVAAAVVPEPGTVMVHLSGSLGLGVLAPHARRASLHPLVPLPNASVGAERLRSGVTFTVSGDPEARSLAEVLGGRVVTVDDRHRAGYHAAATIAANHVVALLGQVERVAATAGLPLDAFAGLVHAAVDDAFALGPCRALTGPAARGDWDTLDRHRAVLGAMPGARTEVAAYDGLVALARRLAMAADLVPGPESQSARSGAEEPAVPATEPAVPAGLVVERVA